MNTLGLTIMNLHTHGDTAGYDNGEERVKIDADFQSKLEERSVVAMPSRGKPVRRGRVSQEKVIREVGLMVTNYSMDGLIEMSDFDRLGLILDSMAEGVMNMTLHMMRDTVVDTKGRKVDQAATNKGIFVGITGRCVARVSETVIVDITSDNLCIKYEIAVERAVDSKVIKLVKDTVR